MKRAYGLNYFVAVAVLITCCGSCKKQSPIIGCTDKAAVNYNGTGPCYYSGTAIFYVDVAIPTGSTIGVSLDSQSQGQTILSSYTGVPSYETIGCASFSENWTNSSMKTVAYKASGQGSLSPGNWSGNVTFTGNQCTPVLLPSGGVTFYTSDSTYVNNALKDILVSFNICGCQIGITQNYPSAPNYGASGCANFILPLGTYSYTAYANNDGTYYKTWTGSFSIGADKQYTIIQLQ